MSNADVTVVIPAYGPSPHLPQVIDALQSQAPQPMAIVVAHSGSSDPTELLSRAHPNVQVLHRSQRMFAGTARNLGLREVRTEWVAFLDSDVVPKPRWLAALLEAAHAAPDRFVVGAIDYEVSGGYWGLCLWATEFSSVHSYLPDGEAQGGASANMFVRTTDVRRAGGFDENFEAGEDSLLAAKLRDAGLRYWFCAAARGGHVNIPGMCHCLSHLFWLGLWSVRCRRRVPLRGSAAARFWPLALGLWAAKLVLIYARLRRGKGQRLLFLALAPGVCLGLLAWNCGFLRGFMVADDETSGTAQQSPAGATPYPALTVDTPQITVIICTYNRATLLARALMAFRDQEHPPRAEIVVVDNNSGDDTADVVRRCAEDLRSVLPVAYVHEPEQGLSRARNAGIAAARGDILAFLDDDAVPSPGWLAAIADAFDIHPEAAAAGGPIEPEFETQRPDWLGPGVEGYYSILDLGANRQVFPGNRLPFGANMALRRGALGDLRFSENLGRKGSSLLSDEESALFRSLRARGGRIIYVPPMRVRHFVPRDRLTVDWLLARSAGGGVSRARMAKGPLGRLALLNRVVLAHAVTEGAHLLGTERDPLLRLCRKAQYSSIYRTLLARKASGPITPTTTVRR